MKRILAGLGLPVLLAFALFLSPSLSFAWQNGDTLYVDKNATGNGSGTSWGDAFKSIKEAVLSVNPGTQVKIFVAQGVYYENNLVLSEGIKLYGSFTGYESSLAERRDVWTNDHWTVIDAERKHRVLNMKDKTEVNGFILRNGLRDHTLQSGTTIEDTRGGGIYIECDDDVVVRNNIIEHCAVFWQGGGIFIEGSCNKTSGAPLIEFNVIRSCTGYCGGGIEIAGVPEGAPGGTDAIIRHNVLRNNPDGGTSELGFGLELWTEYDDQCSPRMGDFYNNIIIGFRNKRDWNIDAADVWVWARNSADRSFISQEWYLGEYLYNGCYKFGNPNKQNIFGSNPMFVDEAGSNYRLRDGSPCIGAGRGGVNIGLFPYNVDPGDTQPPQISNVSSGGIASTSATVAWSTNEPANSQVEYGLDASYGSVTNLDLALVTSHEASLEGLQSGTTYHYRIRSADARGNMAISEDFQFTTLSGALLSDDFSGASLDLNKWVSGSHAGNTSTVQSGALRLRTTTSGSSGWVYTKSKFSGSQKTIQVKVVQPNDDGCLGMSPTATTSALTGLYTEPTWYRFYNYRSGSSGPYQLYVQWKRNGEVNGLDVATGVNFTANFYLRLRTDASKIYFEYSFDNIAWATAYSEVFNLTGYTLNDLYFFELTAYSTASKGEWGVDDFAIFSTAPSDTSAPVISSVASSSVTSSGATITWSTNEPADTQVEYGLTTSYGSLSSLNSTLTPNHSVTLSGLSANTAYHYRVKSKDAAGNLAVSGDSSFTTAPAADTQPPVISSVASKNIASTGATVTWSTNEPADRQVEYGVSTSYGTTTPLDTNLSQNHSVTLSGLSANTTYHYRVRSKDAAGNLAVGEDYFFTTAGSAVRAQLRLVKKNYAYPGEGWDNAIDGDTQGWDGTVSANASPPYAIFAFTDSLTKSVSKVRLMTDTGVGFQERWVTQFTVQVSTTDTNASSFTTVLNKAAKSGGAWQEYPVTPTQAKYIKLILNQPSSGWRQIGEFELYVQPLIPIIEAQD